MNRRGFVLVFVLFVVSILVLYVLEFNFDSQVDLQLAETQLNRLKAWEINRSALNLVQVALDADLDRNMDTLEEDWAKTSYYAPYFGAIFPGATVNISIEDESGKLNVNKLFIPVDASHLQTLKLDKWQDERLRSLGENLFAESGYVDAIIDWMDADDKEYFAPKNSKSGGAEDRYYQKLRPAYHTPGRKLDCLDELILIKGIDERIYLGESSRESPGLKDLLTVYSDGKININTVSAKVLQALHPAITEPLAMKIVEQRQETPFDSVASFKTALKENGVTPETPDTLTPKLTIKSSGAFKVEVLTNYQGFKCYQGAILQRDKDKTVIIYNWVKQ